MRPWLVADYLVDNSVWARLASSDPAITERLRQIERAPADLFVTCPPQVLEFCHSARTWDEYERYRRNIALGFPVERAPEESLVLDIQDALWRSGYPRAAGALDILIAGYAIVNDAIVLSADRGFDRIVTVSDLQYEYVAPSS